ncbi:MAG: methyltransferase domain-containing protein [Nitrospirae bacterium]|nr:methyltransferase domain-containing protein [Nitrospirota bacterium]
MRRELSLAEIFQLGYYWETKILLTAVTLDLFSVLGEKERTAAEVARQIGADERAIGLLMNALVAMKVLTQDVNRYGNTDVARNHLVRAAPNYVGHLLLLHDAEWNNWGKLEETIRTGRSPVSRHVFETDPELGANVLSVLDRIGRQSGPGLAKRLELGEAKTLLDLGGGAGTNAIAFCAAYPQLSAVVFDLPQTLKVTERVVKAAGLEGRIRLQAGDFNADPLGGPYDAVLMSDILHYQGPEANAALVKKCRTHLKAGGRLIIKDRFLDESGTGPAWVTAFAVHILINTEKGRCYRVAEATSWMREAGFQSILELERTAVVQGVKGER